MRTPVRLCLISGLLGLVLTIANQISAAQVEPSLQRSSALAALLSVGMLLVAALWTRAVPVAAARADLQGDQGLLLRRDLPVELAGELDWGSRLVLQATPAAVILVVWDAEVILRRGLCSSDPSAQAFAPGPICSQAWQRRRTIHLVDLRHYPGRDEFTALLPELPSVLVVPLQDRGLALIGGWSARCFSSSDQSWIEGWAQRLTDAGLRTWTSTGPGLSATPGSSEPAIQGS